MKDVDDQVGTAEYLGVSPRTLEDWRLRGGGPPYVRIGGKVKGRIRYRRPDVDHWLATRTAA